MTGAVVLAASDAPSIFLAFAAGLVSFVSPCVLPLVPGYLSTVCGLSPDELANLVKKLRKAAGLPDSPPVPSPTPERCARPLT